MPDKKIFTFSYKLLMTLQSLGFVLFGAALLLCPFKVFGILMQLIPWVIIAIAARMIFFCFKRKCKRKSSLVKVIAAVVLLAIALASLCKMSWRDVLLWYGFAGVLAFSAWQTVRILRVRFRNKLSLWRYLGALTVWGMVILMLFKPKSGLSDALTILGIFSIAWGTFMLLLPPPEE